MATLWERIEARDWAAAASVLAPDFRADWPATRERILGRENFIRLQREYPEPWGPIRVLRLVEGGHLVAAEVSVPGAGQEFRCAGIYHCRRGLIREATEYWITVGGDQPLPGREHLVERI